MTLKPREWYEQEWPNYFVELGKSPRLPLYHIVWGFIASRSKGDVPIIIDLGCGDGNFGQMVIDSAVWQGYDFAPSAVEQARKKNLPARVGDLMSEDFYPHILTLDATYVLMEVLEHVEDDLFVLDHLKGKQVILSVPNFDSIDHARYFKDVLEVHDRYDGLFAECWGNATMTYPTGNKVYVLYGRLKS